MPRQSVKNKPSNRHPTKKATGKQNSINEAPETQTCVCVVNGCHSLHVDILSKYADIYLDTSAQKVDNVSGLPSNEGHLSAFRMYGRFQTLVAKGEPAMGKYTSDLVLVALSPLIAVVVAAKLSSAWSPKINTDTRLQEVFCALLLAADIEFKRCVSPQEMSIIFTGKAAQFLNAIGHCCLPVNEKALEEILDFINRNAQCPMLNNSCRFFGIRESIEALRKKLYAENPSIPQPLGGPVSGDIVNHAVPCFQNNPVPPMSPPDTRSEDETSRSLKRIYADLECHESLGDGFSDYYGSSKRPFV